MRNRFSILKSELYKFKQNVNLEYESREHTCASCGIIGKRRRQPFLSLFSWVLLFDVFEINLSN